MLRITLDANKIGLASMEMGRHFPLISLLMFVFCTKVRVNTGFFTYLVYDCCHYIGMYISGNAPEIL